MLDVRRPGVTVALEKAALIQSHCGAITIIDRKGLRRAANGACGVPEASSISIACSDSNQKKRGEAALGGEPRR